MAITATFQANFDQFVSAVKSAENALTSVAGSAQSLGSAITASLATAEIRRFAGDVRDVANQFIGAFAEEQAAVNSLTTALRANGSFTPELATQYEALASQFQRTTTFSDDLIIKMQSLLTQVGNVAPEQMEKALEAATNLSAGLGISLEQATMLVAKAFGQGGEQLGRLKQVLGDTVPKGADMAAVLEAINEKFGGQATAQLETYNGQMQALNNQMSDFQERVGKLIVDALTPLLNTFSKLPESAQTVIVGIVALGTALAPLALSFTALSTVIGPLIPLIGTALTGAFAALLPFLGTAGLIAAGVVAVVAVFKNWDQIVAIAQGVYTGIKTWLVDRFQGIVQTIKGYVDMVTGWWQGLMSLMGGGGAMAPAMAAAPSTFSSAAAVSTAPTYATWSRNPNTSFFGGGSGNFSNTFYVNGTGDQVAREVANYLTTQIKSGTKIGGL